MNTRLAGLALSCALALAAPALADDVIFDSGPIDGTRGALRFDSPWKLAAEFSMDQTFLAVAASLGVWVEDGAVLEGFTYQILDGAPGVGSLVNSGSTGISSATHLTDLGNDFFDVYDVRIGFGGPELAPGTYFFQLEALYSGSGRVGWDLIERTGPGQSLYQDIEGTGFIPDEGENFVSFRLLGEFVDTAVPEPATWALMILGFGLAGAALRRRTHAPA